MPHEPDLARLLERFAGGGWETLAQMGADLADPSPTKSEQAYERLAGAAARVAATPDGKILVEWLLDLTLRKTSWHGQLGLDVNKIAAFGLLREGQNSIVALLVGAILKGSGAAPTPIRQSDTGA